MSIFSKLRATENPVVSQPLLSPSVKVAGAVTTGAVAIAIAATFIAPWEGFAPKPYVDRIGTGQPITWCYGETKADGPVPPMNTVFTKKECTDELQKKLATIYAPGVAKCLHVAVGNNQMASAISFSYNLGVGAFCSGPARYFNAGNAVAACNSYMAYNHAAGRVVAGLTNRRKAERALCLTPDGK